MKSKEQHVDAMDKSTSKDHNKYGGQLKFLETLKGLTHSEKLQRINAAVNVLQQLKNIDDTTNEDRVSTSVLVIVQG